MKVRNPLLEIRRFAPLLIIIVFILFIFPHAVFSQEPSTQSKKSFLWQIQSPSTTVYVLGSIHMMKPDMYPLSHTIEDAFNKSAYLVVEVNPLVLDQQKMQNDIMTKGMYQGGETVKDDLGDDVFAMLTAYLEKINIPMTGLMKFKPGMIVMTVENIQLMKLGYSLEYGIDMYFIKKAYGERPILELETMDEQLALLLDGSLNEELFLKNSILEWEKMPETMDTLISFWENGHADQMAEMMINESLQEHPELLPVYQKIFFDRNKKMTDKIKGYLKTEQTYFVVVGAGHLIGEKGIIHLLKGAGYSVNQL